MKRQWIRFGACVVAAVWIGTFDGQSVAASDRQLDARLPSAQSLTDLLSAWPGAAPADVQEFRAEAFDRQTHALAIGASGSLELKTVSGDITCVAGTGTTATVEVLRRARGRTSADAQLGLTEVRALIDHQGERATVRAAYPADRREPPYSVEISYIVTAPAGTRVSAGSVSGNVVVRNIQGDVNASSVSGQVLVEGAGQVSAARSVSGDVLVTNTTSTGAVNAGSVSGHVRLERVTAPQVSAESVSGRIALTDGAVERVGLKTVSGDIGFSGPMARGGRYEFQSHSGQVHVDVSHTAGFQLQASTFSGAIRMAPPGVANTMASGSVRGSLRTTVGDGSAALVVTTFSGAITIVTR